MNCLVRDTLCPLPEARRAICPCPQSLFWASSPDSERPSKSPKPPHARGEPGGGPGCPKPSLVLSEDWQGWPGGQGSHTGSLWHQLVLARACTHPTLPQRTWQIHCPPRGGVHVQEEPPTPPVLYVSWTICALVSHGWAVVPLRNCRVFYKGRHHGAEPGAQGHLSR